MQTILPRNQFQSAVQNDRVSEQRRSTETRNVLLTKASHFNGHALCSIRHWLSRRPTFLFDNKLSAEQAHRALLRTGEN
jgi:hypothetical protein